MYLLHAAIVADRLAALNREADTARLATVYRNAHVDDRPSIIRRLVARIALGVSQASARLAAWSDPSLPSAEALG